MHSPAPGSRFGRYLLDERIGMGGMGVVFRATDTRLNRTVALKLMAGRLAGNEEFTQRFEREADVMARLDSPHVVTILDHGVDDGVSWIATQFVRGGDLSALLARGKGLGLATAAQVCAQIAEALADAHEAGVIHRDVKPSNVLLRDADFAELRQDPFVYLCDFGIAHTGTTGLTQTGGVAGSWAWLAPERTQGDPGTERSDIYALGCVLFATLTGHAPYAGSDVEVALAQVQQPVPRFAGDDPATARVNAVLAKAMAKDPAARYASAREMRADLLGLTSLGDRILVAPDRVTGTGTGTGTQVRATPTPGSSDRRRRWVPVAAVAAVAVLGGAAFAGWRLSGDDRAEADRPIVVLGDVDGNGNGDVVVRWYNFGEEYKEGRDFLFASDGSSFTDPERRPQPEGLSVSGDVDGDGITEVVGIDDNLETDGLTVTTVTEDGSTRQSEFSAAGHRSDATPLLADVDGDGRDDLILSYDENPDATRSTLVLEVALSTDDGFAEPRQWGEIGNWMDYSEFFTAGDVDGDGDADLVLHRLPPSTDKSTRTPQLRLMLSDGTSFGGLGAPRAITADEDLSAPIDVADVDGDGVEEILALATGETATVQVFRVDDGEIAPGDTWLTDHGDDPDGSTDLTTSDVNGDGSADLVLLRTAEDRSVTIDVAVSDGDSFDEPAQWAAPQCLNKECKESWNIIGRAL